MRLKTGAAAVAWLVLCGRAAAQPAPGSEFRVNSYTTNVQSESYVARHGPDDFLVAWRSQDQDGSDGGIFVRRLSAAGRRLGPEFQVNSYTFGNQLSPMIAARPQGGPALVVWREIGRDGDSTAVFAHRLDGEGRPVGDDFQVNVATVGRQDEGAIAMDDAGGFLVVWTSGPSFTSSAVRFDASGSRVGAELAIADFSARAAAHMAGGGFVVVGDHLSPRDVRGRLLDEAGRPLGQDFLINTYTTGFHVQARVASLGALGFVVAWHGRPSDQDFETVDARRYDAGFNPLGPEFRVSTSTTHHSNYPEVAGAADGTFVVNWTDDYDDVLDVRARRFAASGAPRGVEFQVNLYTFGYQTAGAVAIAEGGRTLFVYDDSARQDEIGRQVGMLPFALRVDAQPSGTSNGNGVLDPGETVAVAPAWSNRDQTGWTLAGIATSFTGPGSPTAYTLPDAAASYGFAADGATVSCEMSGDCYRASVAAIARPAAHWDATLQERLSMGSSLGWRLHIGGSFADVPLDSAFYRFIETLLHHGITSGCGAGAYCPTSTTTREQMAAFVLTGAEGAGYRPRDCTTPVFGDVPAASPYCRFIEELARRGVVSGCGGGLYCPGAPVTRAEVAVFVLRTLAPELAPPDCGTPLFADVPASSPYCRWIEELARRGVVAGCGGGNYCPDEAVTREQMAVFISSGFGLSLYAP